VTSTATGEVCGNFPVPTQVVRACPSGRAVIAKPYMVIVPGDVDNLFVLALEDAAERGRNSASKQSPAD
jgi:hypothetical protein